jgi:hypothetical protein
VQYSHRFRDSRPEFIYICRTNDIFDDEAVFTRQTYQFIYKQKLLEAEELVEVYNQQEQRRREWLKNANPAEAKHLKETTDYLQKRYDKNSMVIWNEQHYEANLLAIGHAVYRQLKRAAHKSKNVMQHWFSEFNFVYSGLEYIEENTTIDQDIIKISSSISLSDRQAMRLCISEFESFDEVKKTTKENLTGSYSEAEAVCLINPFPAWQLEQNQTGKDSSKEAYKKEIKKAVRQQQIKKLAAAHIKDIVNHLCVNGTKFKEAFVIAKRLLKDSTLTSNAITRLKDRAQLSCITSGVLDNTLNLDLDSAFIKEILKSVVIGEPLDQYLVDESFERGFTYSEKDRELFTIKPKNKNPTDEDFVKSKKREWQKRRKLLGDFFEFKRGKRTIGGKRKDVSIPIKLRY